MQSNNAWINISDLMSGLMMIFLFISVAYMVEVEDQQKKIKKIITSYQDSKVILNSGLKAELKLDLAKWNAELLNDNTIRFNSSSILFETGSSELSNKFKQILNDFFPRYIELLNSKEFRDKVQEVKIEGHTSSVWGNSSSEDERYLKNMTLSQNRAKAVLEYCYLIAKSNKSFLRDRLRANGMAYSDTIMTKNQENKKKSQRVEFKIVGKSEDKIAEIVEELR